jgi:hypothetical protein
LNLIADNGLAYMEKKLKHHMQLGISSDPNDSLEDHTISVKRTRRLDSSFWAKMCNSLLAKKHAEVAFTFTLPSLVLQCRFCDYLKGADAAIYDSNTERKLTISLSSV